MLAVGFAGEEEAFGFPREGDAGGKNDHAECDPEDGKDGLAGFGFVVEVDLTGDEGGVREAVVVGHVEETSGGFDDAVPGLQPAEGEEKVRDDGIGSLDENHALLELVVNGVGDVMNGVGGFTNEDAGGGGEGLGQGDDAAVMEVVRVFPELDARLEDFHVEPLGAVVGIGIAADCFLDPLEGGVQVALEFVGGAEVGGGAVAAGLPGLELLEEGNGAVVVSGKEFLHAFELLLRDGSGLPGGLGGEKLFDLVLGIGEEGLGKAFVREDAFGAAVLAMKVGTLDPEAGGGGEGEETEEDEKGFHRIRMIEYGGGGVHEWRVIHGNFTEWIGNWGLDIRGVTTRGDRRSMLPMEKTGVDIPGEGDIRRRVVRVGAVLRKKGHGCPCSLRSAVAL